MPREGSPFVKHPILPSPFRFGPGIGAPRLGGHRSDWCRRSAMATGAQVPDVGLPDRFRMQTAPLDWPASNRQGILAIFPDAWQKAYQPVEVCLQRFWEYVSPGWAAKFLDEWCTRTMRSKLEPMKDIGKSLRGHRELILNWFRAKGTMSSGIVEGLNNKVKLTTRKSYGFRTFGAIEIALYHNLGALPEPEFTHRFW